MSGDKTAFFYGTLMAPEVFFSVCYGTKTPPKAIQDLHTFTPATLDGFCRHRVQHADYPGIVADEGHSVRGIYATGLTDANVEKLDYFEGSEYERREVQVKLVREEEGGKDDVSGGDVKTTGTYVFLHPDLLERVEWDFEHFRKERMQWWSRGEWVYEQDPNDKARNGMP